MMQLATPDSPAPAAGPRPPRWRAALLALAALGLLAGLPYVRGVPALAGGVIATLLFLLISLLLIREWSRFPLRPLTDALGLAVGLGVWYALGLPGDKLPHLKALLGAVSGVAFLLACVYAGRLLALIIREANMLLPVALVAGLADVFTVFAGPTGEALKHAPKLVEKLSVAIPKLGSAAGPAGAQGLAHIATAGLGDFIFITFFLVSVYRFGLRERASLWSIFGWVAAGMAAVLTLPALPAAPLLPFIIIGFLLANARSFRLSRQEKLQTVLVVGLLAVLLLVAGVTLTAP